MINVISSFNPIIGKDSTILILGSIPSVASLQKNQYYGHNRNVFWHIMLTLIGQTYTNDYSERKCLLLAHKLALWDVIAACERIGSLDNKIKSDTPNDFSSLYKTYPHIKHVFFNGTKAYETYRKKVGFDTLHTFTKLPSTSPAHAISFDKKLQAWQHAISFYL